MKQTDRRSARRGLATGVESLNLVAFAWACGQFEMRNEECEMEHPAAGQPEGRTGAPGGAEIDFRRKPEGASARERDGSNGRERASQFRCIGRPVEEESGGQRARNRQFEGRRGFLGRQNFPGLTPDPENIRAEINASRPLDRERICPALQKEGRVAQGIVRGECGSQIKPGTETVRKTQVHVEPFQKADAGDPHGSGAMRLSGRPARILSHSCINSPWCRAPTQQPARELWAATCRPSQQNRRSE